MYALSNAKCMHLSPDNTYRAQFPASIRILYMPSGSQYPSPNTMAIYLCPSHSLRYHFFPLLSLLQRIYVRVFFLYLPPYSISSIAITPLSKSSTRPSHSLPFSCLLSNLWPRPLHHTPQRARWNAKIRPGCRFHSVVGASVQPNHISCTHSSGVFYSTRSCDQVCFFLPFRPSIIDPLHSGFRCWHHHTVLRSPVRGKIFDTICRCIHRSGRLCFHLGCPHGFDRLL